jgi:2-polyprenyl-6-methoxyphenol hydroxylase-like FAD-dependent oxidoreductase
MNRLIVVGAGPAGLSLALQLAEAGLPVSLVEASSSFSRQFRGDGLMPSGLEALARMGLWPLLEELPQRPLDGWSIWLEGRELFQVSEPMDALQPCRLVPQGALLEAMLQRALALPNVRWYPGQAVRDLLHNGNRISGVTLANGQSLAGALVVGADGRQSLVRQRAGLHLQTSSPEIDVLWFRMPAPPRLLQHNCFLTLVAGGHIASAFVAPNGELQLGWVRQQPGEPLAPGQTWVEAFAALAPAWLAEHLRAEAPALQGPIHVGVQVGLAPQWQRPGLLLLGDAAHPMSPVRAQGINMALRDSYVAARELIHLWQASTAALSHSTPEPEALDRTLKRIQTLRQPEIRAMQRLQRAEAQQGHLIASQPLLRHALTALAPIAGPLARWSWRRRQQPLRLALSGSLPSAVLR